MRHKMSKKKKKKKRRMIKKKRLLMSSVRKVNYFDLQCRPRNLTPGSTDNAGNSVNHVSCIFRLPLG